MGQEADWGDDCFYCMACNKRFRSPLYDVTKEFERTIFFEEPRIPEIDIVGAEVVAGYCSPSCRDQSLAQFLELEQIRATFPDIGPIEACSRCNSPIDMTQYHLTYVETDTKQDWDRSFFGVEVIGEPLTLAVVCQKCAPMTKATKDAIVTDETDIEFQRPGIRIFPVA